MTDTDRPTPTTDEHHAGTPARLTVADMARAAWAGLDLTPEALEALRQPPAVDRPGSTSDLLARGRAAMAQAFDPSTPPATCGDTLTNAAGQGSGSRVESAGDDRDGLSDRRNEAGDTQAELDHAGIMGALIAHGLGELPLHHLAERCRVADVGPGLIGRIALKHRARDGGCDAQAIVDMIEAECDTRTPPATPGDTLTNAARQGAGSRGTPAAFATRPPRVRDDTLQGATT